MIPYGMVPRRALEPSQSWVDDNIGDETFHGFMISSLGSMGKGAASGEPYGPHTMSPRGLRGAHAATWCGSLVALLLLPFGLHVRDGKIGGWLFVSSNSENIFCVAFLKRKTAENTPLALWHLVNRLV